jgi:hypothetical protein
MATYSIVIGIPQLMLTLLANIETATKSNYGRELRLAMHAIRKKYTYNHVHDATLLQFILKELVGTDGICVLKKRIGTGHGDCTLGCQISFLPPSNDGQGHRLRAHQIGVRRKLRQ